MSESVNNNLHEMSDEQLAALSKNGNNDAFTVLIGRYIFTVRSRASGYDGCRIDFEDLVQEGTIGLMHAANSYDSECGASFHTFARLCIDRSIISAVRATLRKKQIPKSSLVFMDEYNDFIDIDGQTNLGDNNPESVIIARENLKSLNEKIFGKLTEFELKVLKLYLGGYTYDGIASALECSAKSVDNALQRLRRKLR